MGEFVGSLLWDTGMPYIERIPTTVDVRLRFIDIRRCKSGFRSSSMSTYSSSSASISIYKKEEMDKSWMRAKDRFSLEYK
ncbi:hypothetical protein QJS10_CPB12g00021 [Acorus calamus]|uniref:Uncharacterized protein n=1 Tax=Acorus calamus TaxID=4465 RepID=A0AAV9DMB1_ACOCL|nr:hypothetical protein QJS10_CPB12g00021 [Acorus calamus]